MVQKSQELFLQDFTKGGIYVFDDLFVPKSISSIPRIPACLYTNDNISLNSAPFRSYNNSFRYNNVPFLNTNGNYDFSLVSSSSYNSSSGCNGTFLNQDSSIKRTLATACNRYSDLELWHKRLGHTTMQNVQRVLHQCNIKSSSMKSVNNICELCSMGKLHALPFHYSNSII
ncbi:uncharacterized protein LOC130966778 [Arachis stenosperma]|uniref:uncharacterized protein LOC130966778 n=1 Tax=Arachis stenosperma TaxID=217475 RepID=UPI0025ACB217|nr:uncharacterized protein LOC130966778 [Arachis stenosperma]